jgi:hypothetical protein
MLNILQNTPWWVFALFALLMWLGFQALKPRTLPIWRLLITPAVFIGWGITSLAASPHLILDWSVGEVQGDLAGNSQDRARKGAIHASSPSC